METILKSVIENQNTSSTETNCFSSYFYFLHDIIGPK